MEKIIRWTVCSFKKKKISLFSLKKSIESWRNLYENKFKIYVCYNNLLKEDLLYLKKIKNIIIINQENHINDLDISPFDTFWKFYPPRIDIDSYEIFSDNDIIFHNKINEIDNFLNSKKIIFSESHKKLYGNFTDKISNKININTGFFGIFPKFQLGEEINNIIKKYKKKQIDHHCDDQGLFCLMLENYPYIKIRLENFNICNSNVDFAPYKIGQYATHFAGINYGDHKYFKKFILNKFL